MFTVFNTIFLRFYLVDSLDVFPMDFAGVFDTRKKVPAKDVATFVGHTNIQTTSIYDNHRQNLGKSAAYKAQY